MLIKSFEGFRPRAIQREGDGWIIGYGHTLSAREGASVSEADAELLLRYDLLPVEKSVNETLPGDLNQHQFDALVSFAFSVGLDRFAGSDVRQRLSAGATGEAADAIMGWPEPALPETALRRRAAERALFVADPASPVALSDLLSAPLPSPAVPTPVETVAAAEPEVVEPSISAPQSVDLPQDDQAAPDTGEIVHEPAPVDPRGAAVAALLGEPVDPAPVIPIFAPIPGMASAVDTTDEQPVPPPDSADQDTGEDDVSTQAVEPLTPAPDIAADAVADAHEVSGASVDPLATVVERVEANGGSEEPSTPDVPAASVDTAQLNTTRYLPYSAAMFGPIPVLRALHLADLPEEPMSGAAAREPVVAHSEVDSGIAVIEPLVIERSAFTFADTAEAADASNLSVVTAPETPAFTVLPLAELVLTPAYDAPEQSVTRPLWTAEERHAPDGSETNLFGEDLTLTQGGSVLRNDIEFEPPARFDWRETGPFIFMGGVGLVSFGASMAAFRRAAEHSGGSDLTIIGWVLALIGLGCVGVSSINLYRKFGLPGGD